MRWLPAQTVKTARRRKKKRLVVLVFEASCVFTTLMADLLSGKGRGGGASTIFYALGGKEDHRP